MPHQPPTQNVTNVYNTYNYSYPGCVFAQKDFGLKADWNEATQTGTDQTTLLNAKLALLPPIRPPEVIFEAGAYLIDTGAVNNRRGLVVKGMGTRCMGPGGQILNSGVILKTRAPGAYCWTQNQDNPIYNGYEGPLLENINFVGNEFTAGGLKLMVGYSTIRNCAAHLHANGIAAHVATPALVGGTAQENQFWGFLAQNCFGGLRVEGGSETEVFGFQTLRTTWGIGGGTPPPGSYGGWISDTNCRVHGGKWEGNDVGIFGDGQELSIMGAHFEGNVTRDIKLYRPSGTSGTRNFVSCRTSRIHVGPFNAGDVLVGGSWQYGDLLIENDNTMLINTDFFKLPVKDGWDKPSDASGWDGEFRTNRSNQLFVKLGGVWRTVSVI